VVETIKEGTTIYPAPADAKAPVAADANAGKTYSWAAHVCDMADINQASNKEWTLVSLNGARIDAGKPPTMKFAQGKASIFGGINRLSGSYALVGESVIMGEIISTKMAGPPGLMELEGNFAATLKRINGFHVHGKELELLADGAVVATFQSAE